MKLREAERILIRKTLIKFNYRRKASAKSLGISPRTLYNKILEFASDGDEFYLEARNQTYNYITKTVDRTMADCRICKKRFKTRMTNPEDICSIDCVESALATRKTRRLENEIN